MKAFRFWALAALCLSACDPPTDLGKVCTLLGVGDGGPPAISPNDDYYDQGTAQCQNLICLRPAGSPLDGGLGFCSSPCTPQTQGDPNSKSDDCNGSSIPLVCRQIALDQAFLNQIAAEDGGQALLQQYLGGNTAPVLCTSPVGG